MANVRRVAVQMQLGQAYRRHTGIFAGIADYAHGREQWRLVIDEWADHTLPARADRPSPYDGLIGRISAQGARRARRLGIPVVNVWYNSPARDLPGVFVDISACGRLRAEHLLARGFRNFGVLFHQPFRGSVEEARAFEETVRAAGCDEFRAAAERGARVRSLDRIEDTFREWKQSMRAYERWLDSLRLPVGLFIAHVDTARVVIEMCRNRGWRVPEDVAVVSGTNEETICERPEPGITSLEVPYEQIGLRAARLLDRLMDEKEPGSPRVSAGPPETILLPPVGIVVRRSTDFHAVEDPLIRRVLRFLDENLHRTITIDSLAALVGVSRRTLTSIFRSKLGRTVAAEITRLRVERAKRELTSTNHSIKKIARLAGFGSPRTLCDAFAREVGCPPREYRRRHAGR